MNQFEVDLDFRSRNLPGMYSPQGVIMLGSLLGLLTAPISTAKLINNRALTTIFILLIQFDFT